MAEDNSADVLTLTAEIVASYLGNANHVNADQIPTIIRNVRQALSENGSSGGADEATSDGTEKADKRAIKKSITPDALISFIDNKPYKTLKRHLSRHGHDIKSYREAYGLPADYPSVAPNYSAARSEMARKNGLGAKGRNATPAKPAASRSRKAAAPAS